MVRDTLGDDAVIVATREEKGSRTVHVTAAIDPSPTPAFEIGRGGTTAPSSDWLQYDAEEDESAIAEELTDVMLRHGVTEDVMDQVISCATVIGMEQPGIALIAAIEHLFSFRPLPSKATRKPVMAVGTPGSGKTLAIAKLAARSVMNGLKVAVVTTDTVRAGGVEQLEAFTKLLRVQLHKAGGPEELRDVLASLRNHDQILVDTSGLNPFNPDEVKYLSKLLNAADIDSYLVLAAGTDAEEAGEMARIFSQIGVNGLIPSRVDIARRLGSILSAAAQGQFAIADASNTPKVADGLVTLSPQSLSALLMPGAFEQQTKRTGTRQ